MGDLEAQQRLVSFTEVGEEIEQVGYRDMMHLATRLAPEQPFSLIVQP
ncbi:MAG TPA: hypothetical protein VH593_18510 [Ktedonobacteraceae bacterium]|jgi:hypothetical protein